MRISENVKLVYKVEILWVLGIDRNYAIASRNNELCG